MSQAASKGMTAMSFGNWLNGPLSIMKGWSWSVYVQNKNEQNERKTATATSARAARLLAQIECYSEKIGFSQLGRRQPSLHTPKSPGRSNQAQ